MLVLFMLIHLLPILLRTISSFPPPQWLLNSGASHYVISNLSNLSLHLEYGGLDKIVIGDGSGLGITHIGSTNIFNNSNKFSLNWVLHVPTMKKKNIISVSKFCKSNDASIEFFPSHVSVKDLCTGTILVQVLNKDDMYEWPMSMSTSNHQPMALVSLTAPLHDWHKRFSHPFDRVLHHLINSHSLPISTSSSSQSLCSSCQYDKSHKLPFRASFL